MRYRFGDCVLDTTLYVLHRAGQPVRLRRKVFQVLVYLLTQRERVVPKQELCEQVWPGLFISDATLESTIATVRRALRDTRQAHRMIQTLYGYGYRFVAPVEERVDPLPHTVDDTSPPVVDATMGSPREGAADALQAAQEIPQRALAPLLPEVSERKLVTVLCCALCPSPGPPGRGDLDTLHRQVQALYAVVQSEAQPYGGTMQPVLGEQVLVVFGAPAAQEDHAQRAVLVALSLQQRLQQASPAPGEGRMPWPPVRMSVHTGLVAVGGLRHAGATAMGVVGETMTQAVALQAAAPPGMLLCSAATAQLVRGVVRLAATALLALPSLPTPVYQLLGLRPRRALLGRRGRRPRSPFVGRPQELATLQAALAQTEAGQGQVVGIVGEPGLGKSRLLTEFHHWLRQRRRTFLAASCLSYAQATPYGPVRELLRRSCRITTADPPVTIRAKLHRGLAAAGLAPEETAPYLLHLLEVPAETELTATHSPQAIRARTIAGLVQLALARARQQPLVLAVENLQWLDPSSEEVLTALVERLAGAALLLLVSYRPGYRLPWIDKSYVTQVALSRLSPTDSRRVVRATLDTAPVAEALVQAMVARAAGNPFFLEELARAVGEHDATHGAPLVPETVQGVLAARIDRLPPAAKHVLQVAAVIGKDVPIPLLHAVAEVSEVALEQDLNRLQAAEFLEESGVVPAQVYAFRHILVQEVAYQSLLADARQQLHQRTAHALATQFSDTVETQPELVAQHYTEAGHMEQAIFYWQRAGLRALQHSANPEAIGHLRKGLELLTTLPDTPEHRQQELDLQITLGAALTATKGSAAPDVEAAYQRARELCQQVGKTPQLFPVLGGLARFYIGRGERQTARELGEQMLSLAQRVHDPAGLAHAHITLGNALCFLLAWDAARPHLEQGVAFYHAQQHRSQGFLTETHQGVLGLSRLAQVLWFLGYPDQALQRSHEALTLARELAHPASVATALVFAAWVHALRREWQRIYEHAEAALGLAREHGFAFRVAQATILRGWALVQQGQGEAGLTQICQGLAALRATGSEAGAFLFWLAEAYRRVGQIEKGLRVAEEALAISRRNAALYRLKGELLLRRSAEPRAEAESCFRQALDLAWRQGAKSLELRAAMRLARLWQQQGKYQEAHDLLAPIYGWFTEGFDTVDLQEAKALLDELR